MTEPIDQSVFMAIATATVESECPNHCYYKMGSTGKIILCARCGRIKVVKESDGEWKVLH